MIEKDNDFVRVFACSTIGNIVEWYDFAAYGALSDILGEKFFPKSSKAANLMESLAVFGAAFFMRPIGGFCLGFIADTVGRKRALEISIVIMVVPSFCIGLLPTYAASGYISTMLLILLRLLQGLAVGGELVTAYVFVAERSPTSRSAPGWTALVLASANIGTLSGIATVAIMRLILGERSAYQYGWRICFFLSLPLGIVGFILRRSVGESQVFANAHTQNEAQDAQHPLRNALRTHFRTIVLAAAVASLWCGGFYSIFIWLGFYYSGNATSGAQKIPYGAAINATLLIFLCLLFLPFAYSTTSSHSVRDASEDENTVSGKNITPNFRALPDTNARAALRRGQIGIAIFALPAFALLKLQNTRQIIAVIAQGILAICLASFGCGLPFFLVQAFPVDCRVAGIGAAYNLSQALFASAAPIVMTALLTANPLLPGLFLIFLAIISFAALRTYEFDLRRKLAKPQLGPAEAASDSFSSSLRNSTRKSKFCNVPSDDEQTNYQHDDVTLVLKRDDEDLDEGLGKPQNSTETKNERAAQSKQKTQSSLELTDLSHHLQELQSDRFFDAEVMGSPPMYE